MSEEMGEWKGLPPARRRGSGARERYGAREGGEVAAVWGGFAAPGFHGRGPRVPPIGLASLRPIGCTLGF